MAEHANAKEESPTPIGIFDLRDASDGDPRWQVFDVTEDDYGSCVEVFQYRDVALKWIAVHGLLRYA